VASETYRIRKSIPKTGARTRHRKDLFSTRYGDLAEKEAFVRTGPRKQGSITTLRALSDALGVSLDDLPRTVGQKRPVEPFN